MKVLSKSKKWISTLYTGLLIRLRDYLITKFPLIEVSAGDESGDIKKSVAVDLSTRSYVTEVFYRNKLVILDSKRFDFIHSYKVQYDDNGRRLYTIYEDNDKLVFNHIGVQVSIGLDGYETDIQIKPKGNKQ